MKCRTHITICQAGKIEQKLWLPFGPGAMSVRPARVCILGIITKTQTHSISRTKCGWNFVGGVVRATATICTCIAVAAPSESHRRESGKSQRKYKRNAICDTQSAFLIWRTNSVCVCVFAFVYITTLRSSNSSFWSSSRPVDWKQISTGKGWLNNGK